MPKFSERRELPYPAQQIYELVADISSYPEFLPWCLGCRIQEESESHSIADLIIGWKAIRERFTSLVTKTPHATITAEYKDGPFHYLHSVWVFKPLEGGCCEVFFDVDFEFRSKILQKIMDPLFTKAVEKMISAFEARAKKLYG